MTITKEGALASFYTVNKAPIKHLRVYFSPKQSGSGNPSPDNIRPIEGWTQLQVMHCKKNIFQNANGNKSLLNLKAGIPVTISYKADSSAYFLGRDKNNNNITSLNWINTGKINNRFYKTITPSIDIPYGIVYRSDGVQDAMIEYSTKMSSYEKYNGTNQTVDWSNDIGTIYGGYVDLISGKLVKEYNLVTFTWGQMTSANVLGNYERRAYNVSSSNFISASAGDLNNKPNRRFCNIAPWSWSYYADSLHYYVDKGYAYVFLPPNSNDNITIQIAILLNTPIEYQLTPQQLQTFIGQNNIWSNADRVEVEYDLAESNDELYRRRNIILQSAPHLETTTNDITNFNTDIIAPIKDVKIYFNPIQKGEGGPSLENIRPITGWTGLDINQTGKNLINPATNPIWKNGTYTINNDGSITISGSDVRGWTSEQITPFPLSKGTYTFSWTGSKRVQFATSENNYATVTTYTKNFTFTLNNDGYIKWKHTGDSGDYPETVYAQIEVGTIATSFEPYKGNTIPITFPTVGKNLLDITRTSKINPGISTSTITIQNGTIAIDAVSSSARSHVMFEQIFPAGTYTIQAQNSGAVGQGVLLSTTEFDGSSYNSYYDAYRKTISSSNNTLTFTLTSASQIGLVLPNLTNESGSPGTLYDIQLEEGSTATAYEPYNNTIYGGYVDLINNEIVETWHSITADGINIKANSQYIRNNTKIGGGIVYVSPYGNHQSDSLFNTTVLCNKLPTVSQQGQNLTEPYLWCARNGMLFVIFYLWNASDFETTPTKQETINATNAWLQENPVTIVYKLNTPIHHPLTPQTLKTFKGINNIWSNANGNTEIKYWTY